MTGCLKFNRILLWLRANWDKDGIQGLDEVNFVLATPFLVADWGFFITKCFLELTRASSFTLWAIFKPVACRFLPSRVRCSRLAVTLGCRFFFQTKTDPMFCLQSKTNVWLRAPSYDGAITHCHKPNYTYETYSKKKRRGRGLGIVFLRVLHVFSWPI